MAGISTIEHGTSLDGLDEQCLFTWVRLSEHPLTGALAAELEPLLAEIHAAKGEERMLVIRVLKAAAAVQFADDALDWVLDRLADLSRRSPELRKRFFNNRRPSEIRRPVLGSQLLFMEPWPSKLLQYKRKDLRELGTKLEVIIAQAKAAQAELTEAERQLELFRSKEGTRGKLTDTLNAQRMLLHGKLGQIRHDSQQTGEERDDAENAPIDTLWADSFFLRARVKRTPTLRDLDQRISSLETQLARMKEQRKVVLERAQARQSAQREAERQAVLAQLEVKRKVAHSLGVDIEQLAALLAQLDAAPPDPPNPEDPDMELPDMDELDPDMPSDDIADDELGDDDETASS